MDEMSDDERVETKCNNFYSIQKMVKTFLTHQNIVDLETGYINHVIL